MRRAAEHRPGSHDDAGGTSGALRSCCDVTNRQQQRKHRRSAPATHRHQARPPTPARSLDYHVHRIAHREGDQPVATKVQARRMQRRQAEPSHGSRHGVKTRARVVGRSADTAPAPHRREQPRGLRPRTRAVPPEPRSPLSFPKAPRRSGRRGKAGRSSGGDVGDGPLWRHQPPEPCRLHRELPRRLVRRPWPTR